jgi:hypothetical protein
MRLVELRRYLEFRKKLDKRITKYYSGMIGIIIFVLGLFSGLLEAVIGGTVTFLISYAFIYGIRAMASSSAENKRSKVVANGVVVDVTLTGEFGLLAIGENKINYLSLQKFGVNKVPEIVIDEDLFISVGRYKFGKLQKLKLGDDIKCQVTIKSMPHGILYRFDFYDVDSTLEKLTEILESVNRFNVEKHQ